jgi:dTDP-4-dehydrorhamnose reductase
LNKASFYIRKLKKGLKIKKRWRLLTEIAEKFYGTYHFSNEGQCSWFDFAEKIFNINKINIDLQPLPTSDYPTPAKRPMYSVLDKSKFKETFNSYIDSWEDKIFKLTDS